MNALKSNEIYGNWATPLLPIEADESINYQKFVDQIAYLIAAGVDGIYSNGTAGEFYNQTEEEFDQLSTILAEQCNAANMPFQIGCSHMSPKISLERIKRILPLKPSAIQIILPDWFPPSMPEIISFLKVMVNAATPIGLVLYNPGHAKRKLSPEDFNEIKRAGVDLVGCKLGGGDEEWYQRMKNLNPALSLFAPGHRLATGISLGANGSYSNMACLNPKAAQAWYQLMQTDLKAALEIEKRVLKFMFDGVIPYITEQGYADQAVDKLLAAAGNWGSVGTRLRWPYQWINELEITKVQAIGKEIIPEFFI